MTIQQVEYVPYNEEKHRTKYLEMGSEYGEWLDNQVLKHYGVSLFQGIDVNSFMEDRVNDWSAIKPPSGVILFLELDGVVGGMGRIDTWDEGIAEVHNIWIVPAFRGMGYAIKLMMELEAKAREYGFGVMCLDTAKFNVAAQNLYRKLGYRSIGRYSQTVFSNESLRQYYEEKVYMEKKL
jgi:ribosomal protein S18 acetylase RimI-like enzyme